ncbi:hypothetical protein B0T16DRAFT_452014 [Cercophora newfieldiana]|uniref:Uncharacterized protein n=1 Tax=Cercophora newfieldiana TaxID=92897 RepID=A0AA40CYT6_9PEZI|nr:hypothetical protein B0T16DRAFT_452014 [Cercophora newfieldiana]
MFRMSVYLYRYRDPQPSSSTSSSTYLESPQDIHSLPSLPNIRRQPSDAQEPLILIRERGGTDDNHVHWVPVSRIEPVSPYRGTSFAHGVVRRGNWVNDVGQMLWLRSDQPLLRGDRSVPAVNLGLLKSVEVMIGDVTWRADKMPKTDVSAGKGERRRGDGCGNLRLGNRGQHEGYVRGPLTLAGAEYRFNGTHFRMCLVASGTGEDGSQTGILEIVSIEDLERYYEDVGSGTPLD